MVAGPRYAQRAGGSPRPALPVLPGPAAAPGPGLVPELGAKPQPAAAPEAEAALEPAAVLPSRVPAARQSPCAAQSGYALLLALVVIFLVFIALALVFAALALRLRLAQLEAETIHLAALADAGMAEALAGLARDPGFPGAPQHAFGNGSIASQISPVASQLLRVTSQVTYAGRGRGAQAMVQVDAQGRIIQVTSWQRIAPANPGSSPP